MATLDLLTLEEAKDAVNFEQTEIMHDLELGAFVTAVSLRLDDLCGPIVQRTITNELHDGGCPTIRPRRTPVASVTTITDYEQLTGYALTAESNLAQPDYSYLLDSISTHNVVIRRRTSGSDGRFSYGRRNIAITYVAGRAATTATVDAKFKIGAALCLQHLWRPSAAGWAQTSSFDDAVNPAGASNVPGWMIPRAVLELLSYELEPQGVL